MKYYIDLRDYDKEKHQDKEVFCKQIQAILFRLGYSFNLLRNRSCKVFQSEIKNYQYLTTDDEGNIWRTSKDDFVKGLTKKTKKELEADLNILFVSNRFNEDQMIEASRYGYNYSDTTSFPNISFDKNCLNNTKQWITTLK